MIIEKRSRTLGWISRLPLPFVQTMGAAVGWLAYALSATYRHRLRQQALAAGATPAQVRAAVAHAGKLSAEVAWLWLRDSARPLGELVEWDGGELIEQAVARGQGLVMLTPHLGMFEVAGRAYAERWGDRQPMTVLYRPARQDWLAEVQRWARVHPGLAPAPASLAGVRQLLRALKMGQTLGLLPDQVPPEGQGVWAPFFGRPAYTMTLAAKLIHHARGSAVVLWCERKPSGRGFRIHVRPLPALPGTDDTADAGAVNATMEALVRESPGQYLWGYNRYKGPRPAEPREEAAG